MKSLTELAANIGSDKPIKNPEEALTRELGTYDDAASKLSVDQKYPMLPTANDPSPFGSLSSPKSGSR